MQKHRGSCLCGAVRFEVEGTLRPVINCHCSQCRKTHGHFGAYTSASSHQVHWLCRDGLKWFRSSEQARRGFCGVCGASLFFQRVEGETLSISAGMLDLPTGLQTCAHIYCADRADYYEIGDELPRFDQDSSDEFLNVPE